MKLNQILSIWSTIICVFVTASSPQLSTIYQFPNETWIENIAVRANGKLLVTLITTPEVWQVDPVSRTAELIHRFTNTTSVFGIAETSPDIFAVATGNWSFTRQIQPGTHSIWTLNLRHHPANSSTTIATHITSIPEAHYLEGMTIFSPLHPNTILVADAFLGQIFSVHIPSATYTTALSFPQLQYNASAIVPLGVNGIHTITTLNSRTYLYFTNSFAATYLGRVPLSIHFNTTDTSKNGSPIISAAGAVETIVPRPEIVKLGIDESDDFALTTHLGQNGSSTDVVAWVCTQVSNSVIRVAGNGSVSVVASGDEIAGTSSAAFGRGQDDRHVLYVVTDGGIALPPPSGIVGGKVVAVDTSGSG